MIQLVYTKPVDKRQVGRILARKKQTQSDMPHLFPGQKNIPGFPAYSHLRVDAFRRRHMGRLHLHGTKKHAPASILPQHRPVHRSTVPARVNAKKEKNTAGRLKINHEPLGYFSPPPHPTSPSGRPSDPSTLGGSHNKNYTTRNNARPNRQTFARTVKLIKDHHNQGSAKPNTHHIYHYRKYEYKLHVVDRTESKPLSKLSLNKNTARTLQAQTGQRPLRPGGGNLANCCCCWCCCHCVPNDPCYRGRE